jgi:murein DD-endopeptidase MepM/ murein hydrolase activator NlpD
VARLNDLSEQLSWAQQVLAAYELIDGDGSYSHRQRGLGILVFPGGSFEYLHMADIRVRPGQIIRRGEVIGHVGHTGRVTGPVLHYGAVLHGAHVNPMLLTNLLARAVPLGKEGR